MFDLPRLSERSSIVKGKSEKTELDFFLDELNTLALHEGDTNQQYENA